MIVVANAISVAINISSSRSRIRSSINVPPPIAFRHARACAGHRYLDHVLTRRRGWPGHPARSQSFAPFPAMTARRRSPAPTLVGRAPRLLEELVDQGLADAACDILVDRLYRLAHRGVLLRRQLDDLALASFLYFGKRVIIFLRRLAIAVFGGFLHGLLALLANVRRQAIPELLVGDDDVADVAVIGFGDVLLHLMHFLGVDVRPGVLLAVDHAGLQRL